MPYILKRSPSPRGTLLLWLERLLLGIGLVCLGLVAYAVIDARWFQYRQGSLFDRARAAAAARSPEATTSTSANTAAGRWSSAAPGAAAGAGQPASETDRLDTFHPAAPPSPPAAEGSLMGRIEIPRVGISALVLEGISGETLRRGVGHVPNTAMPRQLPGNVGLAGHRDSVFRGLKDVRKNDLINVETLEGTYRYGVDWMRVVDPDDVGVLAGSNRPELTLVTCYPFYYVGSAPERFVVRAHLLEGPAADPAAGGGVEPAASGQPAGRP
jgi:sortase A